MPRPAWFSADHRIIATAMPITPDAKFTTAVVLKIKTSPSAASA